MSKKENAERSPKRALAQAAARPARAGFDNAPLCRDAARMLKIAFSLASLLTMSLSLRADGVAEMAQFAAFGIVDPANAGAQIATAREPKMAHPRDLAVQAWCVVDAPFAQTVSAFVKWDSKPHPPLGSYLGTREVSAKAIAAELVKAPDEGPVRALESATQKLPGSAEKFQLAEGEAAKFAALQAEGKVGVLSAKTAAFWADVLASRSAFFTMGKTRAFPAYQNGVRADQEIGRLWDEMPAINKQFNPAMHEWTPEHAWGLSRTDDIAAASITANYVHSTSETWQRAAITYYASSGFYAFIELYQFWPVTVKGKPQTLLWRGGAVASGTVEKLRGIERTGATSAMMRETRKSLEAFRKVAEGQ